MRLSERRKSRAFAHFSHSKSLLLNVTRIYLVIVAFWGEFGIFKSVLWSCHWPKLNDAAHLTTHVLLLSDPQIRYAASWHETWSIERVLFDLNLRKSWHVARQLRPDVTIMMGDMLAQGKSVKDEASYERYANHFHDLFQAPSRGKLYYIPGNNDVGMGSSASRLSPSRQHFQQHFGPLNQIFSIRNHTLVLLDSPGLVDEDYQRSARGSSFDDWIPLSGGSVEFVKNITRADSLILLTHIPLYRPDRSSCGSLRERGTIRKGVGHGYQNTLGKQTTEFLLHTLRPAVVFT
ncbi:hypothetical protein AX16_010684 [Volvariella volvacea WC 439]|nr:hypothetical protein AX16_010684 [Volvariella volvacea WC 439]